MNFFPFEKNKLPAGPDPTLGPFKVTVTFFSRESLPINSGTRLPRNLICPPFRRILGTLGSISSGGDLFFFLILSCRLSRIGLCHEMGDAEDLGNLVAPVGI
jgi:hypothetical protein